LRRLRGRRVVVAWVRGEDHAQVGARSKRPPCGSRCRADRSDFT
jgi:hypothetical protein